MTQKIQSYEIIERIGIGGMGIVYKAKHSFRNEIVAIKSLSPQYCHDPQLRERFRNEANILDKLSHPNIVKVLDFIEEKDELHLVMEFVPGKTLDKIIGRDVGPIHYKKALLLFNQMLEAVSYAHSMGVIHRDLKPSNIIVDENNNIKITDFGIAKVVGDLGFTKTGTKMGTIYYMSPEQIKGERLDEQSDIYSLGVTLYEMLAGRLPFDKTGDTSEFTLMDQIVNTQLPDPRDFYPSIPEWLVDIVKYASAKYTKNRIKNCQEFKDLLDKGIGITETDKTFRLINIKKSQKILTGSHEFIPDKKNAKKSVRVIITSISLAVLIMFFIFVILSGKVESSISQVDLKAEVDFFDTTYFSQEYSDSIKTATLNFSGRAGVYKMITPTDKLIDFRTEGVAENFNLDRNDLNSHTEINFQMKSNHSIKLGNKTYKNAVELSLNPNPEWDLNFDVGAASLDLDLTQYKVNKLDIDMGAAALNVKFGNLEDVTRFKLDAGASDIDILIPDSVGCEIKSDAALSSKNYEGFTKISKDLYRSEKFNKFTKKIFINIDCGVSSLVVKKYHSFK